MSGTSSDNKSQWMTKSDKGDNEWQRLAKNDIEWQRMTASGTTNKKEWEQIK